MAKFNKVRLKVGEWGRIRLWDHRKNDDDVREYYVIGRVHRISKRAITLDSWALIDPESADRDPGETCETLSILKKAMVEVIKVENYAEILILRDEKRALHQKLIEKDKEIVKLKAKIQEGSDREIELRKQIRLTKGGTIGA